MIYLDNAATTLLKPPTVASAVKRAIESCASAGRGGHPASERASNIAFQCREAAAALFGVDNPENIVFTMNATHALNIAIKSVLYKGGKAVISAFEHNAVLRPLNHLRGYGVSIDIANAPLFDREGTIDAFSSLITKDTACVVCTHVSNVFGYVLPIEEIDGICAECGVPLIIDAAQSAGCLDIDYHRFRSNPYICMPGHKGLFGPQGTGILICPERIKPETLMEGGTGSSSLLTDMPDELPDRLEAGTQNIHGIAGLLEGIKFVSGRTTKRISEHSKRLISYAERRLSSIDGVSAFADKTGKNMSSALSFNIDGLSSEIAADKLGRAGIAVRGGLHCAPLAHKTAGTLPEGTVRISVSWFNTFSDIDRLIIAVKRIKRNI